MVMADNEFKTKKNKIQTWSVKLLLVLTVMEKYPFFLDLCINFLSGRQKGVYFNIALLKKWQLVKIVFILPHLFGILI